MRYTCAFFLHNHCVSFPFREIELESYSSNPIYKGAEEEETSDYATSNTLGAFPDHSTNGIYESLDECGECPKTEMSKGDDILKMKHGNNNYSFFPAQSQ